MITIPAMMAVMFFSFAMLWAAAHDTATMTIPDRISLLLLAGYFLMAPLAGFSLRDIGLDIGGAAVAFALLLVAFSRGWIGGGDAKLMSVTALWLGAAQLLPFLLWTSVFGAVLTAGILAFRCLPLRRANSAPGWVLNLHGGTRGIPYGVAIAAAGLSVISSTRWLAVTP